MASQHDPAAERKRRLYVPRLDTPGGVRRELARLYTDARKAAAERGPIDTGDAYRLAMILGTLTKAIETDTLAVEVEALKAAEAARQWAEPRRMRRIA